MSAAPAPATGARFDLDRFEQNIRKALAGEKATGYAYAINVNDQLKCSGKGGVARRAGDNQNVALAQSPTKRMNSASVTKTITAAAVLKAIQDKKAVGHPNLTIHSKVDTFLPTAWARGPGVKELTFRELLSQYNGMKDNGDGIRVEDLQKWIADGVTREKGDFEYINCNFAFFRVILPYMLANEQTRAAWNKTSQSDSAGLNAGVSAEFRRHVRETIFDPMGIKDADFKQDDPAPTLFYNTANEAKGIAADDWLLIDYGNGVQAALLINSLGTYADKILILRDAFDNAWVVEGVKARP